MYSSHKYDSHANNEHYLVDYNGRKICVCQLCTCGKIICLIENRQT